MTTEGQYAQLHAHLAARIREVRKERGISATELARHLGVNQSTVSRFETGRMLPSVPVVRRMAEILALPAAEAAEITDLARTLATEFNSWRVVMRRSFADHQAEVADREMAARRVVTYEAAILPGLLQLPDYTRAVLARVGLAVPADAEAIAARMRRQTVLYDTGRRFDFLIAEGALRARVCPPEVLRAQWERLLTIATMENVSVRVVPVDAEREVVAFNSFTLFDEDLVVVETQTAETVVRDADDIAVYRRVLDELDRVALDEAETAEEVRRLLMAPDAAVPGRALPLGRPSRV